MKLSFPIFRLKRQAKLLARETGVPLHKALDKVARDEGFQNWSHLAASASERNATAEMLAQFSPGDLVLIGARPGHGKTLLGLGLAAEAARAARQGLFFTLEYSEADVLSRLHSLGIDPAGLGSLFAYDTSDNICADYVIERLNASPGAVAVIDYLQLLDQKRSNPELIAQIEALKSCAVATGAIIILISQIDRSFGRSFGHEAGQLPGLRDVRLPNPLDLSLFTKTCFMHEGELRLEAAG